MEYDFTNNAVEVNDLSFFYNLKETSADYFTSQLTVFKATVYVSSFESDYRKYSFNTTCSYHLSYKRYTTGTDEVDSARRGSLGISNEDIYKRRKDIF